MVRLRKPVRSLAAGLAGFLLTLVAWAQDGGVGTSAPGQATRIDVRGVLIAPRSRSALINGRILRVGDRIDGIEIVAIDDSEVRLRSGDYESAISVGTSLSISRLSWSPVTPELIEPTSVQLATIDKESDATLSNDDVAQQNTEADGEDASDIAPETVQVASVPELPAAPVPVEEMPQKHSVAPGETLSEIAEIYLVPGVRRYQLMMALFEANPHAFNGNINRMRAGVELNIPDVMSLTSVSPGTAMANVMEQTDHWRSERPRQTKKARSKAAETYGPVSSGETLSHIAYRLSQTAADAAKLMSALYDANPHAFGNSMDMLREGAVLSIPDEFHFDRRPEDGPVVAQVSTLRSSRTGHD